MAIKSQCLTAIKQKMSKPVTIPGTGEEVDPKWGNVLGDGNTLECVVSALTQLGESEAARKLMQGMELLLGVLDVWSILAEEMNLWYRTAIAFADNEIAKQLQNLNDFQNILDEIRPWYALYADCPGIALITGWLWDFVDMVNDRTGNAKWRKPLDTATEAVLSNQVGVEAITKSLSEAGMAADGTNDLFRYVYINEAKKALFQLSINNDALDDIKERMDDLRKCLEDIGLFNNVRSGSAAVTDLNELVDEKISRG